MLHILCWLWLAAQSTPQKGEPLTVHVKEVHRSGDENDDARGFSSHITAIAESKTVIYSLKCDEYFSREKHTYSARCFPLEAGKDYSARKFPTAISFWQPEDRDKGSILLAYDIESEKEK